MSWSRYCTAGLDTAGRRRHPGPLPITGGIPTSARTLLSLPPSSPDRKERMRRCAVDTLVGAGAGRGFSAAGLAGWGRRQARDRQQGQAAAFVSPLRCAPSAFINGGGCAASLINQWKRLRRSSIRGDRWAMPAWAPVLSGPTTRRHGQHRSGTQSCASCAAQRRETLPATLAPAGTAVERDAADRALEQQRRGEGGRCATSSFEPGIRMRSAC